MGRNNVKVPIVFHKSVILTLKLTMIYLFTIRYKKNYLQKLKTFKLQSIIKEKTEDK